MDKMAEFEKEAKSTVGHEYASSLLYSLPYLNIPHTIGTVLGSLNARDLSAGELEELIKDRGNAANYIPGVGGYRLAQRGGQLSNAVVDRAKELGIKKVRPTRHAATEFLSGFNPLNILGSPIGLIAGAAGKHRTLDEQVEHDSKPQSVKNLLIPGYGAYHSAKRLGASRDVMEKDTDERAEYERLKKKFEGEKKKDKKDDKDKKND